MQKNCKKLYETKHKTNKIKNSINVICANNNYEFKNVLDKHWNQLPVYYDMECNSLCVLTVIIMMIMMITGGQSNLISLYAASPAPTNLFSEYAICACLATFLVSYISCVFHVRFDAN